jgi:hypothetical protein
MVRGDIFCGGGPVECPSLLGEAPRYLALVGLVAPTIAIGVALDRTRVVPRFLSASSILLSSAGLLAVLVLTVAAYDAMISSQTSGRLDLEYRPPILPPVMLALGGLWPLLIGGWMTLTSLQLLRLGVPVAIAGLGVLAGFAVVLTYPYATGWFVYGSVLPLELICSLVWATSVGLYLTTVGTYRERVATRGRTAG